MKPRVIVGIHTTTMLNPHWKSLRPAIWTPNVDILLNFDPRVSLGEDSAGNYGLTRNFDILVTLNHELMSSGRVYPILASVSATDIVQLNWLEKKSQILLMEKLRRKFPELDDESKWRWVRSYIKNALGSREYEDADIPVDASEAAENIQNFGKSEWLVMKPFNGAMGHCQIKIKREYIYDILTRGSQQLVEDKDFIKFSPDWFGQKERQNQFNTYAGGQKLIPKMKESEYDTHSAEFFRPHAPWIIQEYVDDIDTEYRFIMAGNRFWVRERGRTTADYPQANFTPYGDLGEQDRMVYRICENTNELDCQMVDFAIKLSQLTNQRLYAIDFFRTKSGQLGVFEFHNHFGIDNTDPSFVCEVWERFIANEVIRWVKARQPEVGMTAYEVAVKAGYKGTEAQWRETLTGEPVEDREIPPPKE